MQEGNLNIDPVQVCNYSLVHGWSQEMVDKTVAISEEKLGVVVEKLGKC